MFVIARRNGNANDLRKTLFLTLGAFFLTLDPPNHCRRKRVPGHAQDPSGKYGCSGGNRYVKGEFRNLTKKTIK